MPSAASRSSADRHPGRGPARWRRGFGALGAALLAGILGGCDDGTVVVQQTPTPISTPVAPAVTTRAETVDRPPENRGATPDVRSTAAGGHPETPAATDVATPRTPIADATAVAGADSESPDDAPSSADAGSRRSDAPPVRRTRSATRRRAVLKLPPAERGEPIAEATVVLTGLDGGLPGADILALALLRADVAPGGTAVFDPAGVETEPDARRRRDDSNRDEDEVEDAGPADSVAVHLHPVPDLEGLAASLGWAAVTATDAEARTITAAVDPAALAKRAFGGEGPATVVAVEGLAAFNPPPKTAGFGQAAAAKRDPADEPANVAAEHLRRLTFAGGPDGDPATADGMPGPPGDGGWTVRTVHFAETPGSPHYLVASPVPHPAAFAAGLKDRLPGVTLAAISLSSSDAEKTVPPVGDSAEQQADQSKWDEFPSSGVPAPDAADVPDEPGDAEETDEPAATPPAAPGSVALLRGTIDPAAETKLTNADALPDPCAGDAAAFSHALAARRRAREAAEKAGGPEMLLWKQGESSPDRTPRAGEDDLAWSLRVVGDGCEDADARREAYGVLAAADPGELPDAVRGRVAETLAKTLPAAVERRDGKDHLAAMLRWADGADGYRAVGDAASKARTPEIGLALVAALTDETARRGRHDPAALHAALPLLTTLGTGDAAAELLVSAGPLAEPAALELMTAESVPAREAAVTLLERIATPEAADTLTTRARAELHAPTARRLRLLANRLRQ